jgi:hypothetical protein
MLSFKLEKVKYDVDLMSGLLEASSSCSSTLETTENTLYVVFPVVFK